jgi:hypothetical protein
VSKRPGPPPPAGASQQSAGRPMSVPSQQGTASAPPSVRAQLLTTEHWSLLATRSTAQSEILSHITTFLMLVSASIVSLALVGQVTRFDRRFITFALVLLGMVVLIGSLTQMRVGNANIEDLAHVIGMNRLRAAYVELDPGIERYLVTSAHDDDNGLWQTYNHLEDPKPVLQPLASSGIFIAFVNAGLTGVFAALAAVALGAPGPLVGIVAAACGLSFLSLSIIQGIRRWRHIQQRYVSLFPGSETTSTGRGDGQTLTRVPQLVSTRPSELAV